MPGDRQGQGGIDQIVRTRNPQLGSLRQVGQGQHRQSGAKLPKHVRRGGDGIRPIQQGEFGSVVMGEIRVPVEVVDR